MAVRKKIKIVIRMSIHDNFIRFAPPTILSLEEVRARQVWQSLLFVVESEHAFVPPQPNIFRSAPFFL